MLTQLSALLLLRRVYSFKNPWFYSDLSTGILYSTATKSLIVSESIADFRCPPKATNPEDESQKIVQAKRLGLHTLSTVDRKSGSGAL